MHPATRQSDTQRHLSRIGELATQLHAAQEENAKLRAELAATMLPYQGHTIKIIGGVATVFMHGGDVWERVQRCIDRPGEAGYEYHWQKVESIPGSPAARIDAAMPIEEMGCVGEQLERSA